MSWIDVAGITLSSLTALAFTGLLIHSLWTHALGRPATRAGPRRRHLLRWAWPVVLASAFFVGFYGAPLRRVVHYPPGGAAVVGGSVPSASLRPVDQRLFILRAPFYLRQRTEERPPGAEWRTTEQFSVLQLPWVFLCAAVAYLLFGRGRSRRHLVFGGSRTRRARLSLM